MNTTPFRFDSAGSTDTGRVRTLNEDRVLVLPRSGLWVVADGMGGHDAGEVASTAIVESLATIGAPTSALDQQARFYDRLMRANDVILQHAAALNKGIIGSTLVSLMTWGREYRCVWSGDSRAYVIRRDTIMQISKDHTEAQALIDQGLLTQEEARSYPRRNIITRAIGAAPTPQVEVVEGIVEVGDTFLLCSDGLTGHLSDEEILEGVTGRKAESACQALIETTLERGATDNVSVVIVQARSSDATVPLEPHYA